MKTNRKYIKSFEFFNILKRLSCCLLLLFFQSVCAPGLHAAGLAIEEIYPLAEIESGIKKEITSEIMLDRSRCDNNETLIDDSLPAGAKVILPVAFDDKFSFSGARSITLKKAGRQTAYYVHPASEYAISTSENIVFYAKSPAGELPSSFLIAFYDETGSSEHRACFGPNVFDFGGMDGTFSSFDAGGLSMEPGVWHRVIIPAASVGLGGHKICGVLLAKNSGAIFIDKITRSEIINDPQKFRFEKVENILTIYKNSFSGLLLTPDNASPDSSGEVTLKHSNGKIYSKKLKAGYDSTFIFDLIDDNGTVIPSGTAVIELKYTGAAGSPATASAQYDILQLIANIQLPWNNSIVNATVPIFGDALGMDFSHYTLSAVCLNAGKSEEIKLIESKEPKFLVNRALHFGGKATVMGNLASFNAGTNFGYKYDRNKISAQQAYNGLYRLVLKVYDTRGNMRSDSRDIIVGRLISNTAEQFVESADGRAALIVAPYSITEGFTMCSLIDAATFLKPDSPVYANAGMKLISPVYEARPRGLKFDRPALFRMSVAGEKLETGSVAIFKYGKDSGWLPLDTLIEREGELSSPVASFNEKQKTYFAAFTGDIDKIRREKAALIEKIAEHAVKPPPIEVSSQSHPFLVQCDFENGASIMTPRSIHNNVELTFDSDIKAGGSHSLKITNKTSPSDCAVNIFPKPFDAAKFPVLSFDYNCPATVEINIMLKARGRYFEIPLSSPTAGSSIGHTCLPRQNFIRDGIWHNFTVNLYGLIKNVTNEPKENEPLIIEEIFFCDYDYEGWAEVSDGRNPAGAAFNIDNLIISSGGSIDKTIKFSWRSNEDNIKKFSFTIDDNPYGAPGADVTSAAEASFNAGASGGGDMRYLHITGRGADGKELTAPSHYAVKIDNTPPQVTSTTPSDGSSSASLVITAVIDDFNGSGVSAASVKCEVDGFLFEAGDGALTYDTSKKLMKIEPFRKTPAPPGFIDGQSVRVKILGVRDNAGNAMKEPYSFTFRADFASMTAGRDAMLTSEGGFSPSFTPDSKTVVYCALSGGRMKLYSIDIGGKKQVLLSGGDAADYASPRVMSDGTIIACKKPSGKLHYELVSMRPDGSGEKTLLALAGIDILTPAVSPAAPYIYFSAGNDIYSFNIITGENKKLLSDLNAFMLDPAASPDGKTIAFRKDLYTNTLWLCGADGSGQRALTLDGFEFSPAFSPDGGRLVFARYDGEISSIYSVNADGSQITQIVRDALHQARRPAVSPDGRYLAYESTRTGVWNISLFSLIYSPPAETGIVSVKSPDGASGATSKAVKLNYSLPDDDTLVSVKIYSAEGALVRTLADNKKDFAGARSLIWDGSDSAGKPVDPEKPYVVKYEFSSKNSAAPAVKVSRIALGEKAAKADIDFSALRRDIQADEDNRKTAELKKISKLVEDVKKGGDDIPPAPVSGFRASPGVRKIELSWTGNAETDLAGYSITRESKETGARDTFKIPAGRASYADLSAESGKTYSYSIRAFDAYDNASAARELSAAAEFDYLYYALPYNGSPHLLKFNLNELVIELYRDPGEPPLLRSAIVAPENLQGGSFSFACHEGFYTIYCLNEESGELYYAKSAGLKSFSAWELVSAEFYAPPDASSRLTTAFICAKDSKTITAVCLDRDSDSLYEGEIKKNSSKISWKLLRKGFITPPGETLTYSLDFKDAKYRIYAADQMEKTVYTSTTANLKAFSAWSEEIID
jgi:hypothetical protein